MSRPYSFPSQEVQTNPTGTMRFRPRSPKERLESFESKLFQLCGLRGPLTRSEVKWSNSVRPNLIYAAHFEQKVLFWFIYLRASNPKVLSNGNWSADIHVQSTWVQSLACRPFEYFSASRHALGKMLRAFCIRTN